MKDESKVIGMDIALNHGAVVELTDGELSNFWYWTDIAGAAARSKRGKRLPIAEMNRSKDKHVRGMIRLAWIEHYIDKQILMKTDAAYVGIEDYALRMEQGAHQMGEVGGIARILCWFRGLKVRLHDPTTVKMFGAHDGTCQKDAIERAVAERWDVDFSSVNPPPSKPSGKVNRQTSEDLADAYVVAQMVWYEVQLRAGRLQMEDMHAKEIQVFNRTTKTYPINLLSREWIENPDGVPTPHDEPVCDTCGSRKCCLAKKGK